MSKLVVLLCVIGAFAVAPAAWADSSTVLGGYGSNAAKPVIKVKAATALAPEAPEVPATAATATASDTLPFTGSDLTLFAVGGVILVGLGFGLRRMKPDDE